MVENTVGEEDSKTEEDTGSPMWRFLKEEYDYKRPQRGDIRYAEVVRVDDEEIIVDIGGKTEGVVPTYDLQKMGPEARDEIEVGNKVPVYVLRPESAEGNVIVSLNMARTLEDWRRAEKLLEEGETFEGTVAGHNKGGLLVYFGQIRGFVPSSQLMGLGRQSRGESRMDRLAAMEGQELVLKPIEVDRQRRRLIFSERAAARQWRERRKEALLNELQEGDIRVGKVRNLCDFGAFVDLGGADGLVHISELSWRRVKHPREALAVGDEVEVYVLRVDRRRKRIGLSLKRLKPDPWQLAEERYHADQIVKGIITNVVSFGAFARVEDGIEGLIHISELADGDFSPRDLVREGEEVYLKILGVDAVRKRMSLSLKEAPTRVEMEGEEALGRMRAEAEVEAGLEEELAVAAEPEVELEVVVRAEEEALVESEAEIAEELAVAAEPEVEPGVTAEAEEGAVIEAEAEIGEELAVAAETEVEPEVAVEAEGEALVEAEAEIGEELAVAAEAEMAEELAVAAETEVELVVAVEAEEEGPVESEVEIAEELAVAAESEMEPDVAVEAEEEAVIEAEAEIAEGLGPTAESEAAEESEIESEVEEETSVAAEAETEEESSAATGAEVEPQAAVDVEEEALVEAETDIEEEMEAAAEGVVGSEKPESETDVGQQGSEAPDPDEEM